MNQKEAHLIIDIGTGNVRAAVVSIQGEILGLQRENVGYEKDNDYPDSIYFNPSVLWEQVLKLCRVALAQAGETHIIAISATSQREGIVVMDDAGKAIIGMPNIDHRGRAWESMITDKSWVYQLTGRFPTSLFSALKLAGLRAGKPSLWEHFSTFTSISDWVQYEFSGVMGYEHSQASETLLYDVEKKAWSKELCAVFSLSEKALPPLMLSGSVLGKIHPSIATALSISEEALIIVGGSDTQLAIRSTEPSLDDVVVVSGTTTPIIKVTATYITDKQERTWTSRYVDEHNFMLEANAGVTGLNYQRLKEIFYPNESYDVIEQELEDISYSQCIASLGSLIAEEDSPLTKGGFIFNAPVSHQLTRGSFVFAILWDIACSIYENYKSLCEVSDHQSDYIWVCGGGVQSRKLRQFMANLFNKKVRIRDTYRQSSVLGAMLICNDALGKPSVRPSLSEEVKPQDRGHFITLYKEWKTARHTFQQVK